jgi:hypothetical protein
MSVSGRKKNNTELEHHKKIATRQRFEKEIDAIEASSQA